MPLPMIMPSPIGTRMTPAPGNPLHGQDGECGQREPTPDEHPTPIPALAEIPSVQLALPLGLILRLEGSLQHAKPENSSTHVEKWPTGAASAAGTGPAAAGVARICRANAGR